MADILIDLTITSTTTRQRPRRWTGIRAAAPALRIVPDELWHAANTRIAGIRTQLATVNAGGRRGRTRDIESPYLLSGFARCARCGGSLCVLNRTTYGCMAHHKRGAAICTNGLTLPMDRVDQAVLSTPDDDVFQPAVWMALLDGVTQALRPKTRAADADAMRTELHGIDREVARLTEAIAAGGQLTPLLDAAAACSLGWPGRLQCLWRVLQDSNLRPPGS